LVCISSPQIVIRAGLGVVNAIVFACTLGQSLYIGM